AEGQNSPLVQLPNAVSVAFDGRRLVHVLEDRRRTRLDAEEDSFASALGHQVEGLFVAVATPKIRKPVEAVVLSNHHPAEVFEPRQRDVERVIYEDQVLSVSEFSDGVQLVFDSVHARERQLSCPCWIVTERATESTTARRPGLNRLAQALIREVKPVDGVVVERV